MQPYVALGAALKSRGFDVTICTGQGFDDLIEAHGLASRSASINYRDLLQKPEIQDAMHSFKGKFRAYREVQSLLRQQHDEMLKIAREVAPDLLISNSKGYVAHNIARSMGIPSIPTMLQPLYVETGEFPPAMISAPTLGRWGNRIAHRLLNSFSLWITRRMAAKWAKEAFDSDEFSKIGPYIDGYHPDGRSVPHLHGYSRHVVPKPANWGENEHVTGYWFLEPDHEWRPPEDLRAFMEAGDPPVYVGFGSMPSWDAKALTAAVSAALSRLGRRGVLATGWGGLEAGQQTPDIFHLDHAPHEWLFPRCAAIVHHGGSGTTHEALRWGRPTVICAAGADQPFWGHRVAMLCAGPKPLMLKSLTVAGLAEAIAFALDPDVAAKAETLGEAIRRENGAATAAGLVVKLVQAASLPMSNVADMSAIEDGPPNRAQSN